jgi:hypothetical protein
MPDFKRIDDLNTQLAAGIGRNDDAAGGRDGDRTNAAFAFNPNLSRVGNLRRGARNFGTSALVDTQILPRGYIRNLTTSIGDNLIKFPNMKCKFQFNPQDIQHQIEARKDMYLPILQDPAQLNQPMAGNASFAFELIFDRTMEVNSNVSKQDQNGMPDVNSPDTVGVFHDLRMLYSIIGQGLSQDLMDAQIEKIKGDIKAYASRNYNELNIQFNAEENTFSATKTNTEGDTYIDDPNSVATMEFLNSIGTEPGDASIASFMDNINVGNSAFLIPQPCRVLFSPMFMVDGFVMNTNVLFTKFSSKMIPIQCKVYLQMQAIYIGFAKPKTFVTAQIEQTIEATNAATKEYNSEKSTLKTLLGSNLRTISVAYSGDTRVLTNKEDATILSYDVAESKGPGGKPKANFGWIYQPIWLYGTKDFLYNRPYRVKGTVGGTWDKPVTGDTGEYYDPAIRLDYENPISSPFFPPTFSIRPTPSKSEYETIKEKVFEDLDSSSPYIDIKCRMFVYGPFDTQALADTFKETISTTQGANPPNGDIKEAGVVIGNNRIGAYSVGGRADSKNEWEDFAEKPTNWSITTTSYDSKYNSNNRSSTAFGPFTKNSSNNSIFDKIKDISRDDADPLDSNQVYELYRDSDPGQSLYKEQDNPKWDNTLSGSRESYEGSELYLVPIGLYDYAPDSLLQLVDDVHGLSNKYFVALTIVDVVYDLTGTDSQVTGSAVGYGIKAVTLKGDYTGYIAEVDIMYV